VSTDDVRAAAKVESRAIINHHVELVRWTVHEIRAWLAADPNVEPEAVIVNTWLAAASQDSPDGQRNLDHKSALMCFAIGAYYLALDAPDFEAYEMPEDLNAPTPETFH
jgi:hypothetical protein